MVRRNFWYLVVFLGLACIPLPAQGGQIGLYSTGVDASGTALQTQGTTDLHYTITSTNTYIGPTIVNAGSVWSTYYDPTTNIWQPIPEPTLVLAGGTQDVFVVNDVSVPWTWVSNGPTSQWISLSADSWGGGPLIDDRIYTYQTTFNLTGFDLSSVQISGSWAVDDLAWMYLNGQLIEELPFWHAFEQLYGEQNAKYSPGYIQDHDFQLANGFLPGFNTLEFCVYNGGGPTGLRVEIASATANLIDDHDDDDDQGEDEQNHRVPEPSTIFLLSSGLVGLVSYRNWRIRK